MENLEVVAQCNSCTNKLYLDKNWSDDHDSIEGFRNKTLEVNLWPAPDRCDLCEAGTPMASPDEQRKNIEITAAIDLLTANGYSVSINATESYEPSEGNNLHELMLNKRYWVFNPPEYEESAGIRNLLFTTNDLDEATTICEMKGSELKVLFDRNTGLETRFSYGENKGETHIYDILPKSSVGTEYTNKAYKVALLRQSYYRMWREGNINRTEREVRTLLESLNDKSVTLGNDDVILMEDAMEIMGLDAPWFTVNCFSYGVLLSAKEMLKVKELLQVSK
ncbi:hypothetical protein [Neptuniibacter sp. QD37_11]|uniref:hypothetical protein n=1 Tax=Neptuniibacter sp. QD37_11 TaxID=3398209 RepID=UPI0039F5A089